MMFSSFFSTIMEQQLATTQFDLSVGHIDVRDIPRIPCCASLHTTRTCGEARQWAPLNVVVSEEITRLGGTLTLDQTPRACEVVSLVREKTGSNRAVLQSCSETCVRVPACLLCRDCFPKN